MIERDPFTRLVDVWLQEDGVQTTPAYLERVLARTSTTWQRPAWMSPGRWLPMDTTLTLRARALPPRTRYLVLVALLALVAIAAVVLAVGDRPRLPTVFGTADNGRIAFDANGSIMVAAPDGTGATALPLGVAAASGPLFSPDGTRFAFYGTEPATGEVALFVANADGQGAHPVSTGLRITLNPLTAPSWSPDGSQLVVDGKVDGRDRLMVAAADGSGARIIGAEDDRRAHGFAAWSPDGRWIAFAGYSMIGGPPNVQLIRPDGTGQTVIAEGSSPIDVIQDLQWAPDRTGRLAFVFPGTGNGNRVVVIDTDAEPRTETVVLERSGIAYFALAWSPDGTRIASNHSEPGSVVVNADGTGYKLLPTARCAGAVRWSPDGTRILCLNSVRLSEGAYELLSIEVDGTAPPLVIPLGGEAVGQSAAGFSWQRVELP